MRSEISLLKGFKVGDLVYYRVRPATSPNVPRARTRENLIDKKRVGLVVELGKKTAMGFQMMGVLWNDTQEIDHIAENYLHAVDETPQL